MTVSELIQQLQNYPGDMRVLTLGYEGGYDDLKVRTRNVVFDVNSQDTWYLGTHDEPDLCGHSGEVGTECVVIVRV